MGKTVTKPTPWFDGELVSRIGAVFGKPPKWDMPLEKYMEYLDQADNFRGLPFSFEGLHVYPYKQPVATLMCLSYKFKGSTDFIDHLASYEGEPVIACDALLRGRHSPYIVWYDTTQQIHNERIPYLLRVWGDGKTGMIVSSFRKGEALAAVPACWFIK